MPNLTRLFAFLLLAVSLCAQTVAISNLGPGTVSLAGQWRFHPGDNPQWADPNFDDSGWKLVKVPLSLAEQGYPNFSGYGWYRITLQRPALDSSDLSFAVMAITNVAEFYANGVSIGRFGEFPPHPRVYEPRPFSFRISPERWHGNRLVLAVRLWADKKTVFWRPPGSTDTSDKESTVPMIGTSAAIDNFIAAGQRFRDLSRLPGELVKCAELVLALYLLGLYFTESRRPEYLWLGINFAGDVVFWVSWWISGSTFLLTSDADYLLHSLLRPVLYTTGIFGIWATCEERIGPLLKVLLAGLFFLHALNDIVLFESGFSSAWWRYGDLIGLALYPLVASVQLIFLLRQAWTKTGEIRWFALSYIPFSATIFTRVIPVAAHHIDPSLGDVLFTTTAGFAIIGVGFVLLRRSGRLRSERDRLHAEMLAAQQVQRLLLPAQSVDVPHVHIDTAYLPSQEVGGDFYQIATGDDGALLLIIGDVSGKGLQAALTMSLIVGLWQELVGTLQSPCDILRRFNDHLQRRMSGGFVTCLCARLQPDGQLTIANAGHLAPYLNGKELAILNGLPLGISAESEYDESHFLLAPTDTLILISDGVVEARDKKHSFYGFERLQQALSERPGAEAIARHAQQFGQEDDITAIAISLRAVTTESSTAQTASFAV